MQPLHWQSPVERSKPRRTDRETDTASQIVCGSRVTNMLYPWR
jgi:hypothetical protein